MEPSAHPPALSSVAEDLHDQGGDCNGGVTVVRFHHDPGPASTAADSESASAGVSTAPANSSPEALGLFGKYMSLWVALSMIVGTVIGALAPSVADTLAKATVYEISLPVAVLVWLMIFPMTLRVDFASLRYVTRHPRSLMVTLVCNWVFQPFLMWALALLFFRAIYSSVLDTDTEKQVAINDLLVMALYVPTLYLLLDLSEVPIPYEVIVISVILFVAVPFLLGSLTRWLLMRNRRVEEGEARIEKVEAFFSPITMFGLLATVVLTFIFQGQSIEENWVHILLIAIPLTLHNYISFLVAFSVLYFAGVEWRIAAPAGFISSSNFFELAIAIALSAYGIDSGATLTTTVGVLTEVPVMLSLVSIAKYFRPAFERRDQRRAAAKAVPKV